MSEISKAHEPQSVEAKWYQYWLHQDFFTTNPRPLQFLIPAFLPRKKLLDIHRAV